MLEETILSTIQKRSFSLLSFIVVGAVLLFSTLCMMNTYVKDNNTKIQKIEHFIENEKNLQKDLKTKGLKDFEKINSMFENKKFSLGCCPSTYSTDKGCLCPDDEVKKAMNTRGQNSHTSNKNKKC
jgi:hypothetical protein